MKTKQEKENALKQAKQKEQEYKLLRITRKNFIKQEPNKTKRFFKLLWFYISFPFVWLWRNIKDWRTLIIFIIVFLVVSIEVWLPYLLSFITWGSDFSKTMLSIGSACWLFWLGPGTPFLALCIVITIGVKGLFNKLKYKKIKEN